MLRILFLANQFTDSSWSNSTIKLNQKVCLTSTITLARVHQITEKQYEMNFLYFELWDVFCRDVLAQKW